MAMHVPVSLVDEGGHVIHSTIANMSDEGLMVECSPNEHIPAFKLFSIEVESHFNGKCYAVWQNHNRAGMALCTPIHPAIVLGLAQRFPTPA